MRKFEKRQILKNVGSSSSALAINVMVGVFLLPFILHHLGDAAFVIWVLIFSIPQVFGGGKGANLFHTRPTDETRLG